MLDRTKSREGDLVKTIKTITLSETEPHRDTGPDKAAGWTRGDQATIFQTDNAVFSY